MNGVEASSRVRPSREPERADSPPGFAVYIHWPFCLSKCPYCDFNSHVRRGGVDEARFVRAYVAEIAATAARYVRMQGVQRGTRWGYSLFELEVYE